MTEGQEEFLKLLRAYRSTVEVCEACAATTRDLAAEIVRGGLPKREDLERTIAEAERVVTDMVHLRDELDRVLTELSEG